MAQKLMDSKQCRIDVALREFGLYMFYSNYIYIYITYQYLCIYAVYGMHKWIAGKLFDKT